MMAGWAPASIDGLVFSADVLSQSGSFANWDGYELRLAASNGTYELAEGSTGTNNTGYYTYTRINESTAGILIRDPFSNRLAIAHWLIFDSPDTATYYASGHLNGVDGHQFGTMQILRTRITGTVFNDANNNFVQGGNESGRAGEVVYIDLNNDGNQDDGEPASVTDDDGTYIFDNLSPGTYFVQLATGAGLRQTIGTDGYRVTLAAGQTATRHFGLTDRPLISGVVYADTNRNGQLSDGEQGLAGVRVYVDANDNGQYDIGENFALSNTSGTYFLTAPASGSHRIRATTPDGQIRTQPGSGAHIVTDASGEALYGRNFGFAPAVTGGITGTVFTDANANYTQDSAEAGRAGEIVYLDLNSNDAHDEGEPTATTDIAGGYAFDDLAPGTYRVRLMVPEWHRATLGNRGYDVTVGVGQVTRDFGLTERGMVSGIVFVDADANGQRGDSEAGLAGVRIFLDTNWNEQYDVGENFVFSNAAGQYFLSLPPNTLAPTRAVTPDGHVLTQPSGGQHLAGGSPGVSVFGRNFGFATAGMFSRQRVMALDDADTGPLAGLGQKGVGPELAEWLAEVA